jgi:hypothetical protein
MSVALLLVLLVRLVLVELGRQLFALPAAKCLLDEPANPLVWTLVSPVGLTMISIVWLMRHLRRPGS